MATLSAENKKRRAEEAAQKKTSEQKTALLSNLDPRRSEPIAKPLPQVSQMVGPPKREE